MHRYRVVAATAVIGCSLFAGPVSAQHGAGHVIVAPDDLKWSDSPTLPPGAKIAIIEGQMSEAKPFIARLRLPADYRIPPHMHPAIEHVTVLSGALNMGAGERFDPAQTTAMKPGSVGIMPVRAPHFVWTKDETVIQIHGVGPWGIEYVNAADDPRKKS